VNPDGSTSPAFEFTVEASTQQRPGISGVTNPLYATDGRQYVTISGTNFDATAYVNLYDPNGVKYVLSGTRIISRNGSTGIQVDPNFTSTGAGTWQAEVVDGSGLTSDRFSFQVF